MSLQQHHELKIKNKSFRTACNSDVTVASENEGRQHHRPADSTISYEHGGELPGGGAGTFKG
jgi:hypothetical protein